MRRFTGKVMLEIKIFIVDSESLFCGELQRKTLMVLEYNESHRL